MATLPPPYQMVSIRCLNLFFIIPTITPNSDYQQDKNVPISHGLKID